MSGWNWELLRWGGHGIRLSHWDSLKGNDVIIEFTEDGDVEVDGKKIDNLAGFLCDWLEKKEAEND